MQIKFNSKINNVSLQVGDSAYYIPMDTSITTINQTYNHIDPIFIGVISGVGNDFIVLDDSTLSQDAANVVSQDFIMFSKNKIVNNTSMLGYFAEVRLRNNSTHEAEMFALSSEVTASSK